LAKVANIVNSVNATSYLQSKKNSQNQKILAVSQKQIFASHIFGHNSPADSARELHTQTLYKCGKSPSFNFKNWEILGLKFFGGDDTFGAGQGFFG